MSCDCGCGCGACADDCCAGIEPLTPESTFNRPRLDAIGYRIGSYGTFLETMKARLSGNELQTPDGPTRPLLQLTTREGSDPAIALLDAFATMGDVLTFYQERIANEGFLRTATELRSVFELARLVGYAPRPGVAASAFLAYTIDSNTSEEVVISAGARSQTVPGPGELPQSFETSDALAARAAWNVLKPRTTQAQLSRSIDDDGVIYLRGTSTNVKKGDPLLIVEADQAREVVRVTQVEPQSAFNRTKVSIASWSGAALVHVLPATARQTFLQLIEDAPRGATAARVVEGLEVVKATLADPKSPLPRELAEAASAEIGIELGKVGALRAPKLLQWLSAVRNAINDAVDSPDAKPAAVQSPPNDPDAALIAALAKRPSQPLLDGLRLRRSLDDSFTSVSDAGLQVVGAVAPAIRDMLGAGLTSRVEPVAGPLEVHAFRVKAGVFGRNALKMQQIVRDDDRTQHTAPIGEWPILTYGLESPNVQLETPDTIYLDGSYESITSGPWIVIDSSAVKPADPAKIVPAQQSRPLVTTVKHAAAKITRAEYGMSGDTTRVDLGQPWLKIDPTLDANPQERFDNDFKVIRGTSVFADSVRLDLAEAPIERDLCGGADDNEPIELDGLYQDLEPGRFVVLTGERRIGGAPSSVMTAEALMITSVVHDIRVADQPGPWTPAAEEAQRNGDTVPPKLPDDRIHTFLWFDKPLAYCYRRDSVKILGNVVKATHGETRQETLGSGDGTKASQAFTLKQGPLTFVAAPTAEGAETTLRIFVSDVRWQERDSFIEQTPVDRVYMTRRDTEGKATVTFPDGREGARLPTGTGNVMATYRIGIGRGGNARANQISQLSTRPLGVKEVVNPIRASGGADAEGRDEARRNIPNAVMALGRLVSTRDYADFTRGFAGIAKAASVELSDGHRSIVEVTIAGKDNIPIDPGSDLFLNLRRALHDLGDPLQPVQLDVCEVLLIIIAARIRIAPEYRWETVVAAVRTSLLDAFGFERRDLAQDATSSAVLSVMHAVRGVEYVDLDTFAAIGSTTADPQAEDGRRPSTPDEISNAVATALQAASATRVRALPARRDGDRVLPAQLAALLSDVPATLVLNQIT